MLRATVVPAGCGAASHGSHVKKKTGGGAASQRDREARDSAESSVTLTASGEIDIATTAGDAARSLGLQGSGVGQLVGVRSSATLLSTGIAFTTTQIKIVQWNPPEVLLAVTGMESTTMTEVVKQITVEIDDLLPLDKDTKDNESTVDKDPLKRVASVSMQRLPSSCFDSTVKEWMRLSVEQFLQIMACSTAAEMDAKVEVINVSGTAEKGHIIPYVQARAKVDIGEGKLRLFPVGGTLLSPSAISQREKVQAGLKALSQSYMKGLTATATASRQQQRVDQQFFVYSPLGRKGLAKPDVSGTITWSHVAPYWAVMLTDRDASELVNMHSHVDDFRLPHPVAKIYPMNFPVNMSVRMPFLTNDLAVKAGALLVLPFDGGLEEIFTSSPAMVHESHSLDS